MIYGLYESAGGMLVNEYRQSVVSNNIANAETVGFKRHIATFAERLPASAAGLRHGASDRGLDPMTGGVWLAQTETDFSEGNFVHTGDDLDAALSGPGFFVVNDAGRQLLTRDGRFLMDVDGVLRAATDGAPLVAAGGGDIRLDPEGGAVRIDSEGAVSQNGREVARLSIVDVDDYRSLAKVGTGRFALAGDAQPVPAAAIVHAGTLESSAVRPVGELTTMIQAARAYQINAQLISLQDQGLGKLINEVAQV